MIAMSFCAGWLLLWVSLYWCLTLLGWRMLTPLMTDIRRAAVGVGLVGLLAALVWAEPGEPAWLRALPLTIGLLAAGYSWRNQWLLPRPATELQPSPLAGHPDELVAVLSGGQAVSLAVLERLRTAFFEDQLIVHCGLARSLIALRRGEEQRPAAVLPHNSGFFINSNGMLWDGVNGSAVEGDQQLESLPIELCRLSAWRQSHPKAQLLAPAQMTALPRARQRTPRVPEARKVADPLAIGRLDQGGWHRLDEQELNHCGPIKHRDGYLSRWAASSRGLLQTDSLQGKQANHRN